jgi:hypothetical protein
MKSLVFLVTASLISAFAVAAEPAPAGAWKSPHELAKLQTAPAPLIPFPREVTWRHKEWLVELPSLPDQHQGAILSMIVSCKEDNGKLVNAQRALVEILTAVGRPPSLEVASQTVFKTSKSVDFIIKLDPVKIPNPEGYRLEIDPSEFVELVANKGERFKGIKSKEVTITAHDPAGAFYAVQTLRQLLIKEGDKVYLPACTIRDWPAFGMRGFMHDTGRNFQEIASLKAQIDRLAAYKYNVFHWHLTDNPAWRPQSKLFPQLNDPKNRQAGRDPEKSYSFDEIRDLIAYAKARQVKVIPELDMPGHSAYFQPTFGFKMETEQGMAVLEKLIDEFCAEIPAADCPIIHLGSDEVHIPNPQVFMKRMSDRVRANGRQVMVWNPGLKGEPGTIEQLWRDQGSGKIEANRVNPVVDSGGGYLNSSDALLLVQRHFFQQSCRKPEGDAMALGGILCCWPDIRVDDKRKIFLHNPVWPVALAFAEAVWCGRPEFHSDYLGVLPAPETEAGKCFAEFEKRLAAHRDRYFAGEPFPYVRFSQIPWRVAGPFVRSKEQPGDHAFAPEQEIRDAYPIGDKTLAWQPAFGGLLAFRDRNQSGLAVKAAANSTMYALTYIHSEKPSAIHAWIGFETPGRANRQCGGIPPAGKWCSHGSTVLVNDVQLPAPAWKQPGTQRYLNPTWSSPANEVPLDDEQFYWSREPAEVPLQAGWNKILLRVPCTYAGQNWTAVFIPVLKDPAGRWIEDLSVKFSTKIP